MDDNFVSLGAAASAVVATIEQVQVACNHCGKAFLRAAPYVRHSNKNGRRIYCGRTCFGLSRRKERLARGPYTRNGEPLAFLRETLMLDTDDCVKWPFASLKNGYPHVVLEGKSQTASRVICRMAHGDPDDESMFAAHSCGKGHEGCVNWKHLRWATPKENMADCKVHGTVYRGERQHSAKLNEQDVRSIRAMAASGVRQTDIARAMRVTDTTISQIVNRKKWEWLK